MTKRLAFVAVALTIGGCCRFVPVPAPAPPPSTCLEWDCKYDTADTPRECACVHEQR